MTKRKKKTLGYPQFRSALHPQEKEKEKGQSSLLCRTHKE